MITRLFLHFLFFIALSIGLLPSNAAAHCIANPTDPDRVIWDSCVHDGTNCHTDLQNTTCPGGMSVHRHRNIERGAPGSGDWKRIDERDGTEGITWDLAPIQGQAGQASGSPTQFSCDVGRGAPLQSIYHCITGVIGLTTDYFILTVSSTFGEIASIACIIYIILLGYKIVFGAARLKQDTVIHLGKIVLVIAVSTDMRLILEFKELFTSFPWIVNDLLVNMGASNNSGNFADITGFANCQYRVFCAIEGIMFDIFGIFTTTDAATGVLTQESFLGIGALVGGLFFTGSYGATITVVVIGFFLTLLLGLGQIMLHFLVCFIAISFLTIITPLMLILWLFKPTEKIFQSWFKFILSYAFQPVVISAFLLMTLTIAQDMSSQFGTIYNIARASMNDPVAKKQITIFSLPSSLGGVEYDEHAQRHLIKDNIPTAMRGTQGYTWRGTGNGYSQVFATGNGATSVTPQNNRLSANFLDIGEPLVRSFITLILANALLFLLIIGFMKQLPSIVHEMVTQGMVESVHGATVGLSSGLQGNITSRLQQLGQKK